MKYAYVTLLYPNKNGTCTYLDGAILTALGLRKQNVKYKIICMVTKDVSDKDIDILKLLYDDIVKVDYITPIKKLNGINIISDIFPPKDYKNQNEYTDIVNVFTKLHIFNSELFNYDKLLFIDNDLIPIDNYDELFNLNCPAGMLENILEDNKKYPGYLNKYTRICDIWEDIKHGDKIPNIYTKLYKVPGRSVNSGLLLIKPNKNDFDNMIRILQTPKIEWQNIKFPFKGSIDFDRKNVDYYILYDQDFLTQYFQDNWHMIDPIYCFWGDNIKYDINGIHMAGLYYIINDEKKNSKTWQIQIPINDGFNMISNKIALWGFEKYPKLKNILYNNLKFYVFNKLYSINDIKISNDVYNELNRYQKKIIDLYNK